MADVFISYHRSPGASALVRRIAGELENRGVSCWYDTQNAAPVDFVERIVMEIESCKAFVFVWDEQANEDSKKRNSYVRSEIQCAYGEKHIALFPFQVGDFEKNKTLKFYFGHINIPYGGNAPETAQTTELVNAISDVLGKTQPPPIIKQSQVPSTKIIKSGYCGKNVTYTLDENGVLTIYGNGSTWDFYWDLRTNTANTPWWNERNMIFRLDIQYGVNQIGTNTFGGCRNLTKANIPNSINCIHASAFSGCYKLQSVSLPDWTIIDGDTFPFTSVTRREREYINAQ